MQYMLDSNKGLVMNLFAIQRLSFDLCYLGQDTDKMLIENFYGSINHIRNFTKKMEISVISMEICTNVIVVTSFTWKGQGQMQYTNQKGLHFFFF